MTQFSGQITQLLQGVSQQHPKDRAEGQNTAQVNCISDIVEGLRRRPALKVLSELSTITTNFTLNAQTAVYSYSRGDGNEEYIILVDTLGRVKVYDAFSGAEKTITNSNQAYLADSNPRKNLKFHTIGDSTFVLNKSRTIDMHSAIAPEYDHDALVYAVRASYGHTYKIKIAGVTRAQVTTPSTVTITTTSQNKQTTLSSVAIMEALVNGTNPGGWTITSYLSNTLGGDWNLDLQGDVLHIRYIPYDGTGTTLRVAVEDGNHGNDLKCTAHSVRAFEDLPKYAPQGYEIEISGTGDERFDNYWVKWVADNWDGTNWDVTGLWQECIAPGMKTSLDESSMPTLIKRKADGTFENVTADWVSREAGDDDTNPVPSFVGGVALDIGSYMNRLYMLSGENVIMSRAFDQLAFFASSVAQPADDDPIDSASSDTQITDLLHSAIYNGALVLFSNNAQFIHPKDEPIIPANFAVSADTKFNLSPDVAPVVTGANIMFPTEFGNFTHVWEYNLNTVTGSPQAESTTKHIPRFIVGKPIQMVANTTTDYVFLRTDASDTTIYVNQFYVKDQKRAQLAWHAWDVENCDNVHSMTLLNQRLFLLTGRDSKVYLEFVDLSLPVTDNSDFEVYADHYYTDQVLFGDWTVNAKDYNCRVPTSVDTDDLIFIQGTGCDNPGFLVTDFERNVDYTYLNVKDAGSGTCYVIQGYRYNSYGTVSNPYVRDGEGRPYTKKTIIDEVTFNTKKTGFCNFTVGHASGVDYTEQFNGMLLNNWQFVIGQASELDTDIYLPVRDYRSLVTINFASDHHLGFALMSMDWIARVELRGRRSQ